MDARRPLGYWLRHLHNLLETHFALVLADLGTTRGQWQLLNTLAEGPRTRGDLRQALAPFWRDDRPSLERELADLASRGWIEERAGTIALTGDGAAAHAELAPRVADLRSVVTAGLTPEQYRETVRVLAVMAGNVEAAIAARGGVDR